MRVWNQGFLILPVAFLSLAFAQPVFAQDPAYTTGATPPTSTVPNNTVTPAPIDPSTQTPVTPGNGTPTTTENQTEPPEEVESTEPYQVRIISPVQEETFQNNTQNLTVVVELKPKLRKGDSIVLLVDGQEVGEPSQSTIIVAPWLPRGQHTVQVKVISVKGQNAESEIVTFYQQRVSSLLPAS